MCVCVRVFCVCVCMKRSEIVVPCLFNIDCIYRC